MKSAIRQKMLVKSGGKLEISSRRCLGRSESLSLAQRGTRHHRVFTLYRSQSSTFIGGYYSARKTRKSDNLHPGRMA